jgi:hypothetical protein
MAGPRSNRRAGASLWQDSLFYAAAVASAFGGMLLCDPALAQSWDRLADGRVVVEIFGQRVGLPASPTDVQRTWFHPRSGEKTAFGKSEFTLEEALADRERATRALAEEPNWVSIYFRAGTPFEGDLLFGQFPRGLVPALGSATPLVAMIHRTPRPSAPPRGTLPDRWPPESTEPDADGYFVRRGIAGPRERDPSQTGYRLPASQRLWPSLVDLVVLCERTGGPVRVCGQTQQTEDGRIRISWRWVETGFRTTTGCTTTPFPSRVGGSSTCACTR